MRISVKITALIMVICTALCGCATMRYPAAYKVEGKEFREFKELDDDKALKLVALIYNVKGENWEDNIARSVTLGEYLELLRKRKSQYIKKSGIFNIKYDKVQLSKWKDEELEKLYNLLVPKADGYNMEFASKLTETQNAERIVYLTAISAVIKELERRDNTNKALAMVSQVLVTALSVALSMI